ncbi:hypothetical protein D3C79_988730 [compost metagenome]
MLVYISQIQIPYKFGWGYTARYSGLQRKLFGIIHYDRAKIEMLCKLGWIIVKY